MLKEIREIIENRGIDPEIIVQYTEKDLPSYTYKNMDKAKDQFNKMILEYPEVGVLYDVDVDGLYAGQMIVEYLKLLQIHPLYMMNESKKHGITDDVVEWVKDSGIEYLIVVDAGTHDNDKYEYLNSQGVKVLILDHHDVRDIDLDKYSDIDKTVIVNCNYEGSANREISGAGVVYKFITELNNMYKVTDTAKYKSWVGITILSDSCNMLNQENRYYVKYLYDNHTKDPLFSRFVNYGSSETMFNFTIIPLLNSCIRMGRQDLAIDLVTYKNPSTLKKLIEEANGVRELQKQLVEESLEVIKQIEGRNTNVCTLATDKYNGIVGLIANKVLHMNNKATIVMTRVDAEEVEGSLGTDKVLSKGAYYKGSFRGNDGVDTDTLKSIGIKTIGHKKAAGVFIEEENFKTKVKDLLTIEVDHVEKDEYEYVMRNGEYHKHEKVLWNIAHLNEFSGPGFDKIKIKITGIEHHPGVREYEKVVRYLYSNYEVVDFDMDRDALMQSMQKEIIVTPVLNGSSFKMKLEN